MAIRQAHRLERPEQPFLLLLESIHLLDEARIPSHRRTLLLPAPHGPTSTPHPRPVRLHTHLITVLDRPIKPWYQPRCALEALWPFLLIPDTYQVILLAFRRVLGVPLLLPVSLLKIVVAVVVVVTGVGASAPASTSGSKLLWHKWGKGTKDCVRSGEKPLPAFCPHTFLAQSRQQSSSQSAGQLVSSHSATNPFCSSLQPRQRTTRHKALPTDAAAVKVSGEIRKPEAPSGFLGK